MADDCKYIIDRANLHYVRKQASDYLCQIDERITVIENSVQGGIALAYQYTTALAGDPTSGYVGGDTLVTANVTELRISKFTRNGNDATAVLAPLDIGALIGIFEEALPNNTAFYETTATPVDQGTYYTVAVVDTPFVGQALPSINNADITLHVIANAAGLIPSGGDRPQVLKKNSATNYDAVWELVDHAELAGIGVDDHHKQVHNHDGSAAEGGSVPHANLTGVSADQHHPQSHSHDGGDGSGTVAHDNLTGVSEDQHHDKTHSHDGLDGSGSVDHASLIGILPNQHHNQAHLLYGADQSDVDSGGTPQIRHGLFRNTANTLFELDYRAKFVSPYVLGATYYPQEMVLDGAYLMSANVETTEPAAPQNVGDPFWAMPDAPVWSTFDNVSLVGSGHQYDFTETLYVNSVRLYVPVEGVGIIYRLTQLRDGQYITRLLPDLTAGEWNVVGVDPTLVFSGSSILFYLESQNSGGDTIVTGGWTRASNSNNNEPANASWNVNNALNTLRIDFDDLDAVDRQAELEGIITGSEIQLVETAASQNSYTFQVLAPPVTRTTCVEYTVALVSEGTDEPPIGEVCTITATIPVPQSTEFVGIANGWAGNQPVFANVTSFLAFDGVDQGAAPDNQYGVDINVQRLTISPDWGVMAISGGGGGSGGGDFTPEIFAGAGTSGYVPDPISESGKVMFDDSAWRRINYGTDIDNKPVIPTTYWTGVGSHIYNSNVNNVGIGTNGTPSYKFTVRQSFDNQNGSIGIQNVANNKQANMFINADGFNIWSNNFGADNILLNGSGAGNVGIGVTTPAATLDVQNAAQTIGLLVDIAATPEALTDNYWSAAIGNTGVGGYGSLALLKHDDDNYDIAFTNAQSSWVGGLSMFGTNQAAPHTNSIQLWSNEALFLYTNGADRLVIDNAGNVGIGTTAPLAGLHVAGTGFQSIFQRSSNNTGSMNITILKTRGTVLAPTTILSGDKVANFAGKVQLATIQKTIGELAFVAPTVAGDISSGEFRLNLNDAAGALQQRITVLETGFVGIGTTAPIALVHIVGEDDVTSALNIDSINDAGYASAKTNYRRARGTQALPTATLSGDQLAQISARGHDGADFTATSLARIQVRAAEDTTPLASGAYMRFDTTAIGTAAQTERMRITDAGFVGIGTTAPLGILHVKTGESGAAWTAVGAVIEGLTGANIQFLTGSTGNANLLFGDVERANEGRIRYSHSLNEMQLRVASADQMVISGTNIIMPNLPTADPAISGALWNDGGTVKISP